jgi:hypothetical protein
LCLTGLLFQLFSIDVDFSSIDGISKDSSFSPKKELSLLKVRLESLLRLESF